MTSPDSTPRPAFLLDGFTAVRGGREVVCATGRMADGTVFGLVDDRCAPTLYLRRSEFAQAQAILARDPARVVLDSPLKTMDEEPVVAVTTPTTSDLRSLDRELRNRGVRTYEADVDLYRRYLIDRDLRGLMTVAGEARASEQVGRVYANPDLAPTDEMPELSVVALDIETDVVTEHVTAVGLVGWGRGETLEEVHVVDPAPGAEPGARDGMIVHTSETALLAAFVVRFRAFDPDVVTGWNLVDFDLPVLARRMAACRLDAQLGRTRSVDKYKEGRSWGQSRMQLRGRQVLDAMRLVRGSGERFDDMRLGTVAQALLGRGKTLAVEEWEDKAAHLAASYRDDLVGFAAYCLEDARLVRDILRETRLLDLTISRSRLIGLPLERAWGSVAAFDQIYLTSLRRHGYVGPTIDVDREELAASAGGLVLTPEVGLHHRILAFDFKSLYPSLIRTFNIDPLAYAQAPGAAARGESVITGPNGARFSRSHALLTAILDQFFEQRERAKAAKDPIGSHVYKIIMNSFYGVLGTDSCRFAAADLAGGITAFGHEMLRWTKRYFETELHGRVLYGDTDSLFVDLGLPEGITAVEAEAEGARLAAVVNAKVAAHLQEKYGVTSRLDLEFDNFYRAYFLPPSRAGEGSRAKSYAGLVATAKGEKLEITGMEAVRSDWTELGRRLQRELLTMLFAGAEPAELSAHVSATIAEVRAGKRDAELVYRKAIRKPLESYVTTTPPHVKAARLLPRPVRIVRYVVTELGPQPLGFVTAPLDYDHYLKKQLLPIAEGIPGAGGFVLESASRRPASRSLFGD